MPAALRNQRAPTAGDTPAPTAASSLEHPAAMAAQNRWRSSRRATEGRPSEGKAPRPDRSERRLPALIATSSLKVLRRPLEPGLFAFREATVADAEALEVWLRDHAVTETRDIDRLAAALEERCRAIAIEPPTPDRIERIARAAIHAHEERFATTVHARLPPEARERLDALLHPARAVEDGEDIAEPVAGARAVLNFVRGDPGRASVNSVKRELERLAVIRGIALPDGLLDDALPHEVELCRQRVSVQPPSDLRRLPEATRLAWLAAYAHLRGPAPTHGLVELWVETVHAIGARAERRVELKVINEFRKVTGKTNLLY